MVMLSPWTITFPLIDILNEFLKTSVLQCPFIHTLNYPYHILIRENVVGNIFHLNFRTINWQIIQYNFKTFLKYFFNRNKFVSLSQIHLHCTWFDFVDKRHYNIQNKYYNTTFSFFPRFYYFLFMKSWKRQFKILNDTHYYYPPINVLRV